VEITRRECNKLGGSFNNPRVVERLCVWTVYLEKMMFGSPYFDIDNQTGEVVDKGSHAGFSQSEDQ